MRSTLNLLPFQVEVQTDLQSLAEAFQSAACPMQQFLTAGKVDLPCEASVRFDTLSFLRFWCCLLLVHRFPFIFNHTM
jgi:hypothetical protein